MLTSGKEFSPFLWFVTVVPAGVEIRSKFKLQIDRSVKTPWQVYG